MILCFFLEARQLGLLSRFLGNLFRLLFAMPHDTNYLI